jgi:hypothetical protein
MSANIKGRCRRIWDCRALVLIAESHISDRGLEFPRALQPVAEHLYRERQERS